MKLLKEDGPLIKLLSDLTELVFLNVVFLIFCIPIFTIGTAVTALYRSIFLFRNGNGSGTVRDFLKAFRQNLKKATVVFLLLLPFLLIIFYEALTAMTQTATVTTFVRFMRLLQIILLTAVASYAYPLQAQFENRPLTTVKNALCMMMIHFPATLIMTASNLVFPVMLILNATFLIRIFPFWLFLGFSVTAWFNAFFLEKIFKRYLPVEPS